MVYRRRILRDGPFNWVQDERLFAEAEALPGIADENHMSTERAAAPLVSGKTCRFRSARRVSSFGESHSGEIEKQLARANVRQAAQTEHGSAVDPDGELVARIAEGDQDAARKLVDLHLSRMVAVSRRLLGKQEDAEEVAQEVFLKVWTNARKWQPGQARFATWMHRVAVNLCYDRLRKRREIGMEELPERVDEAPDPSQAMESRQLAERVERAMKQLPDRQRLAIVLCHHQGLTNIEAAEIMEISVDALESLLARGRRGLRKELSSEIDTLLGDA